MNALWFGGCNPERTEIVRHRKVNFFFTSFRNPISGCRHIDFTCHKCGDNLFQRHQFYFIGPTQARCGKVPDGPGDAMPLSLLGS